MDKIENIDDIRSLIALGIEECTTLEYKSGIDTSNNHWKSEMAKDVSKKAIDYLRRCEEAKSALREVFPAILLK